MEALGQSRVLQAGETLFRAGDTSDTVYLVVEGNLQVVHTGREGDLVVGTLNAGDIVGEITAVIGGRRTATVRAGDTPTSLRELTADQYSTWLADRPQEAQRIAEQARDRIDHTRVARVLTELIGVGHNEVIDDVNEMLEWTRLEAGDTLFVQGDDADAAYIVVTGRLQLTAAQAGVMTLDVPVGRGDIVGELGVIEQAPRSASAVATRDSTLARLSIDAFETLTTRHPKLMLQVFRKILTRVMRPQHRPPHAGMIAVAVLAPGAQAELARSLATEIERHGATVFLDRAQVREFFNRRGVVDAVAGTAESARLDEFLSEVDVAHEWVVLETDPTITTWSSRALRSADRVLMVTSPFPDTEELRRIEEFTAIVDKTTDRELWLVQTNNASIRRPVISRAALERAKPDRILQHHRGSLNSTNRLARLASGTATGVAMSGGGARAFAQAGALCALAEHGISIDVVTGTSMGSVVASSLAYVEDPTLVTPWLEAGFAGTSIVDYTVPVVALSSGRGLTDAIDNHCGPILIEELALPFSCLSTNLTTAELVEHRRGRLAHALRASVSLPGVFPPVVVDGDLLVDGGVMENLPVGPLVRDPAVDQIIAIDVAPPDGPSSRVPYGSKLAGGRALRDQLSRSKHSPPGIANTVMASMLLSSARARNDALAQDHIDLYLSLNLRGVKLLDFDGIGAVAERGYEATVEQLTNEVVGSLTSQ